MSSFDASLISNPEAIAMFICHIYTKRGACDAESEKDRGLEIPRGSLGILYTLDSS